MASLMNCLRMSQNSELHNLWVRLAKNTHNALPTGQQTLIGTVISHGCGVTEAKIAWTVSALVFTLHAAGLMLTVKMSAETHGS